MKGKQFKQLVKDDIVYTDSDKLYQKSGFVVWLEDPSLFQEQKQRTLDKIKQLEAEGFIISKDEIPKIKKRFELQQIIYVVLESWVNDSVKVKTEENEECWIPTSSCWFLEKI